MGAGLAGIIGRVRPTMRAGCLSPSAAVECAGLESMSDTLRLALVGCGAISAVHIDAIGKAG
ncbi:MAG: hypothetical protein V3R77_03175, partial [Candidatus Binatia bacterium]